jgi:hypothetical protein
MATVSRGAGRYRGVVTDQKMVKHEKTGLIQLQVAAELRSWKPAQGGKYEPLSAPERLSGFLFLTDKHSSPITSKIESIANALGLPVLMPSALRNSDGSAKDFSDREVVFTVTEDTYNGEIQHRIDWISGGDGGFKPQDEGEQYQLDADWQAILGGTAAPTASAEQEQGF